VSVIIASMPKNIDKQSAILDTYRKMIGEEVDVPILTTQTVRAEVLDVKYAYGRYDLQVKTPDSVGGKIFWISAPKVTIPKKGKK
jgi:hypothetical protein